MGANQSHDSQLEKLRRLKSQSNEDIEKIKKWRQEIYEQKRSTIDEVYDKFDEFRTALETKREETCEHVRTIYDRKTAEFDETISKLERQLEEINQLNFTSQRPVLPNRGVQLNIDCAPVTNAIEQLSPVSTQPTVKAEPLWDSPFIKKEPLTQQSETSPVAAPSFRWMSFLSPPLKRFCPGSRNTGQVQPTLSVTSYGKLDGCQTAEETEAKANTVKRKRNVRRIMWCRKCCKPRCIYSELPISTSVTNHLTTWQFECGKYIPQWNEPCKELTIDSGDCNSDVSTAYFSSDRMQVCYKCGSLDQLEECSREQLQNFSYYHPVCRACASSGIKPRTRKKCQNRKTDTQKTESDDYYTQKNRF